MIVKPETLIFGASALTALGIGVHWLVKILRDRSSTTFQEFRDGIEWPPPPPLPTPSLSSRLNELGRIFNVLFDYVGSRTIFIGKLILVFNDKGVSVRVQDSRLPAPNMEIAFFDEEEPEMHFYLNDTSREKQERIIEWVRSQVESEIAKRKIELDNALTIIASIMDEAPSEPTNTTME